MHIQPLLSLNIHAGVHKDILYTCNNNTLLFLLFAILSVNVEGLLIVIVSFMGLLMYSLTIS